MPFDLLSLGWDDEYASAYARFDQADQRPARVTRVDRGVCTVLAAAGPARASLAGTMLAAGGRDPIALPCAGDWVVVRTWPDECQTIEAVLPRRTAIVRATAGKESLGQVLAANVDAAAVVEPMHPAPDFGRIERLLALAWESGAKPLLVLTKADLTSRAHAVARQIATLAPDIETHGVSTRTGSGLDALRPLVAWGRTLGLLGASGAGKSSLVNALAGATVMTTQALRADGRGRHTTAYRALVPLPGGGAVLDTPGVRGVGLFDAATGLDRAFADVTAFAERCRFTDCAHRHEPGCAVLAAVEDGRLSGRRLESWHRLRAELAGETRRRHARLSSESVKWLPKQERRRRARP
jgi:ribosome biogenesis GTPase / thiamine phosphate phosphatase